MSPALRTAATTALLCVAALSAPTVQALEFRSGDTTVVLNTNVVAGAAWRLNGSSSDLIGKSNLNPTLCNGHFQSCQGLFRSETAPAERLRDAPGMPSLNFDDGNLNYGQGDVVQAPFRINQDIKIERGNFGFFARWLTFYDFANNSFTEFSPNRITPENVDDVGQRGDPAANRYFDQVFGPGGVVRSKRRNGRALEQLGTDLQLLDFNFFGRVPLPLVDRDLEFRIGRQTINWGESTVLVINSVNQANPANTNNLFRTGFTLDEVFTPVGMATASVNLTNRLSLEAYYQYEWDSVEIPPQGGFFSFLDLGTPNIGDSVNASFGGAAEDPDAIGTPLNSPLALITPTTVTIPRRPDDKARDQGQYGVALKWFLPDLNDGTEFGFYFMNYHSKLPYASFDAVDASCARAGGNPMGMDATNTLEFLQACPNLPVGQAPGPLTADLLALAAQRPGVLADFGIGSLDALLPALGSLLSFNPNEPVSDTVGFDTARIQLEYPEDRKMLGISFNTPAGPDYSLQGEIAYRPNLPLQVSVADLAFAAFGPSLTACHREDLGCNGSTAGVDFDENGNREIVGDSDFVDAEGNNPYPDTVNLIVGSAPGSARSFPNFVLPYRGQAIGENAPNGRIRGWEPFQVLQYNLGATRVYGSSEAILGADQIIMIYELGATHVPGFPDFDELQIEGPLSGTTHASAGADGSGADGSRQACSTNPSCTVGPDGLRFNPYQADRDQFAHRFSWGYRIVSILRYDSVLPGISIEPTLIWGHDVHGNAPGPGANFIEGRKTLNATFQFRYRTATSFNISYQMFTGGGANHIQRDRDNLGFFIRYQF